MPGEPAEESEEGPCNAKDDSHDHLLHDKRTPPGQEKAETVRREKEILEKREKIQELPWHRAVGCFHPHHGHPHPLLPWYQTVH